MKEFYATVGECDYRANLAEILPSGTNVLFPASSYIPRKRIPRMSPDFSGLRAADSGGFVASFRHNGNYQYTPEQYVRWLEKWQPHWAALMDFCCEDEITSGKAGIVAERQRMTTDLARQMFERYADRAWVWVPTIQGWQPGEYEQHAAEMKPLIDQMQSFYSQRGQADLFRVGIGTLCRRASVRTIIEIVRRVSHVLPGVKFHLWGVKLDTFKSKLALPTSVLSVDSAAYNGCFGRDMKRYKTTGLSRSVYSLTLALPEYQEKLAKALATPKQTIMF
jgi:hypothetical protein